MLWTTKETEVLAQLWLTSSASSIGRLINKTTKIVKAKAHRMGLARKTNFHVPLVWTIEKTEALKREWNTGKSFHDIAMAIGVTRSSAEKMASRLGLQRKCNGFRASGPIKWTTDKIEALKAVWAIETNSTQKIADDFDISRDAAKRQARKLGLTPKPRNDEKWSQLQTDILKNMWVKNSAAEIGRRIGMSRKSVIGKAWRMKLPTKVYRDPNNEPRKPAVKKPKAPKQPQIIGSNATRSLRAALRAAELKQIVERPMPTTGMKLVDLERHHCRWPFGESPNLFFCGEDRFEERSYCLEHCRIAYETVNQRIARSKERLKVAA